MKKFLPILLVLMLLLVAGAHAQDRGLKPPVPTGNSPYYVPNGVLSQDGLYALKSKAVDGDDDAQFSLGYIYAQGNGVKQDYAEAAQWFRKAAEQGNISAQTDLAFLYAQGNGVGQDYAEAARWFEKAAGQGDAVAQYNLGLLYADGKGVKQSWQYAAQWFRAAADGWKPRQ
jgi:TPR repeat protein